MGRTPFGVNYDSSKRKYINFTSDCKFHNRKHLQIVQYEDFHVLHLSGCSWHYNNISMYVQVRNWIQMCCRCLKLDWMYAFDQYQLQGQWCYRRLRHNHRQWMCTLYSSAKTLRDHLRLLYLKGPRFA